MERRCGECKIELEPIKVLDATSAGLGGVGAGQVDLQYAPASAGGSWFTATTKGAHAVTCLICPRCRRIQLYGD
ncbi:MAG: hypothetical protein H0V17_32230 [Deltaproteobacteria bacterium]|nr:hypothetical protein [Deltaproteobacteria bacterium]